MDRAAVLKVIEEQEGVLPASAVLRCRVRYFTDGAVLGSLEFVQSLTASVQAGRKRKRALGACLMGGADWGDLASVEGLRNRLFS
jgi:hypothetical protein